MASGQALRATLGIKLRLSQILARVGTRTKPPVLFFAAVTLCYMAFSPGSVARQGHMGENLFAAKQMAHALERLAVLKPPSVKVMVPRHGIFEPLLEVPFLLGGRLVFGPSYEDADRSLTLEVVIATSLICTLIFIWTQRITNNRAQALLLAVVAAFTTMLWPYAYIGRETTQSLFLMLSGYLALAADRRSRATPAAFAVSSGLAISLKANGVLLAPAIAFLILVYYREPDLGGEKFYRRRVYWWKTSALALTAAAFYALSGYSRSLSATWPWGQIGPYRAWTVSPMEAVLNGVSLLLSINKGLLIYCPVVLLCLLAVKKAFREDALTTTFALLVLGGLLVGSATVFFWSDDAWGPRYLHASVAPLFICLALAKRGFGARRSAALTLPASCGLMVSFLGAFFPSSALHKAAIASSPSNIEQLQAYVNWNPILFDFRLLTIWMRGSNAEERDEDSWPTAYHNWGGDPGKQIQITPVNLRAYAVPQPYLVRAWGNWSGPSDVILWTLYAASLLGGVLLLYLTARTCLSAPKVRPSQDSPGACCISADGNQEETALAGHEEAEAPHRGAENVL